VPTGTKTAVSSVSAFFDATCGQAEAVAAAWGNTCTLGDVGCPAPPSERAGAWPLSPSSGRTPPATEPNEILGSIGFPAA